MATDDQVAGIATALTRGTWVPTQGEWQLASAFLERGRRLMTELSPADMPPRDQGRPWLTQALVLEVRFAAEIGAEFLPSSGLPEGSPVRVLLDAYCRAGARLVPYQDRMLTAWRTDPPVPPSAVEVEEWEAAVFPRAERVGFLFPVWDELGVARSTLTAVSTGDINH